MKMPERTRLWKILIWWAIFLVVWIILFSTTGKS